MNTHTNKRMNLQRELRVLKAKEALMVAWLVGQAPVGVYLVAHFIYHIF